MFMIGLIVLSHGKMANGLIETAAMIIGSKATEKVKALELKEGESPEILKDEILQTIKSLNADGEVLILLDLFGGTPSNICAMLACELKIDAVTGVNLPMLLEVLVQREKHGLKEIVEIAKKAGKEGIVAISDILDAGR